MDVDNIDPKDYDRKVAKALIRLSSGSKYHQPDDVEDFRKRISTRMNQTSSNTSDEDKTISKELEQRSELIKKLSESEQEYKKELQQFSKVNHI